MAIEVTSPGLLATIQDGGRYGMQKYGVVVSGAQDMFSFQVANLLVGNKRGEAAIEIAMYGSSYRFTKDHVIAITGADLQAMIDGVPVPLWRPILVKKDSEITFSSARQGCYAYMAIAGSIDIESQYGSKSTYLRAKIGGMDGRALKKKDKLQIGKRSNLQKEMKRQLSAGQGRPSWFINYHPILPFASGETLNILQGSEIHFFTEDSIKALTETEYMLSPRADRMGYTFQGSRLKRKENIELLSEGVTFGTIQVPLNGQPIILMADRQTTGGYPKVGQVITAHLPRLAQLKPKQYVRFAFVTIQEAEEAYLQMHRYMKELKASILHRVKMNRYGK